MQDTTSRPFDRGSDSRYYTAFAPCEISKGGLWKTQMAARLADELTPAIIARFHAKYEKSEHGCWLWKSGCDVNGYGMFMVCRVAGRQLNVQAHRLAYLLAHGEQISGWVVRHSCNNPPCVNPDHLKLGTQADNMADRKASGHYGVPWRDAKCKLSRGDVRAIRASFAKSVDLARAYAVSVSAISRIRLGKSRKAA